MTLDKIMFFWPHVWGIVALLVVAVGFWVSGRGAK